MFDLSCWSNTLDSAQSYLWQNKGGLASWGKPQPAGCPHTYLPPPRCISKLYFSTVFVFLNCISQLYLDNNNHTWYFGSHIFERTFRTGDDDDDGWCIIGCVVVVVVVLFLLLLLLLLLLVLVTGGWCLFGQRILFTICIIGAWSLSTNIPEHNLCSDKHLPLLDDKPNSSSTYIALYLYCASSNNTLHWW